MLTARRARSRGARDLSLLRRRAKAHAGMPASPVLPGEARSGLETRLARSSGSASNWIFNTIIITLVVLSVLYLGLYWWPHAQGRPSPLDKYAPLGRRLLETLGFAPKTGASRGGQAQDGKSSSPPPSGKLIRNHILDSAEWVNASELDAVEVSGRSATVFVRARMTNEQVLAANREIFGIVFPKVDNLTSLRVLVRVKTRDAKAGGRIRDVLRSDITVTRVTFESLNWANVSPARLPKVADRAKLYF